MTQPTVYDHSLHSELDTRHDRGRQTGPKSVDSIELVVPAMGAALVFSEAKNLMGKSLARTTSVESPIELACEIIQLVGLRQELVDRHANVGIQVRESAISPLSSGIPVVAALARQHRQAWIWAAAGISSKTRELPWERRHPTTQIWAVPTPLRANLDQHRRRQFQPRAKNHDYRTTLNELRSDAARISPPESTSVR